MLSTRSPIGAMIEITIASRNRCMLRHPGVAPLADADDDQRHDRHQRPADEAFDGLVRADPRPQRGAAGGRADEQGADVVGDDAERHQEQRVGAPILGRRADRCRTRSRTQDQHRERAEHADPDDAERRDRDVRHRAGLDAAGADEAAAVAMKPNAIASGIVAVAQPVGGDRRRTRRWRCRARPPGGTPSRRPCRRTRRRRDRGWR